MDGGNQSLVSILLPNFNAKCLATYAQIPTQLCDQYSVVRNRLLLAYDVGPEKLRKAFQAVERKSTENFSDFGFRIMSAFDRWITSCGIDLTYDAIREQLLMDNFYQVLPFSLASLCKDQTPKTFLELAKMADKFDSARDRTYTSNKQTNFKSWKNPTELQKPNPTKTERSPTKLFPQKGYFRDNRDNSATPRIVSYKPPNKSQFYPIKQGKDNFWLFKGDKPN